MKSIPPIYRILFIFFFPLITAFITYLILVSLFFKPYDKNDSFKKLIIVTNDANETGKKLASEKIIKHWWTFSVIAKLRSIKSKMITGEYSFSASMSPLEIVKKINQGELVIRNVQIIGGDTIDDVIDKIVRQNVTTEYELKKKFFDTKYVQSLGISSGNLEGYLFPAIYKFSRPINVEKILTTILNESNKNWNPLFNQKVVDMKMTREDILILASIIEKECILLNMPRDITTMRNISSVYHNRLKKELPLEAISPLLYANDKITLPLNKESKSIQSPYNTFINTGLPPSPICNPRKLTIEAALYPEKKQYISFTYDQKKKSLSFKEDKQED